MDPCRLQASLLTCTLSFRVESSHVGGGPARKTPDVDRESETKKQNLDNQKLFGRIHFLAKKTKTTKLFKNASATLTSNWFQNVF